MKNEIEIDQIPGKVNFAYLQYSLQTQTKAISTIDNKKIKDPESWLHILNIQIIGLKTLTRLLEEYHLQVMVKHERNSYDGN